MGRFECESKVEHIVDESIGLVGEFRARWSEFTVYVSMKRKTPQNGHKERKISAPAVIWVDEIWVLVLDGQNRE